MSVCEREGEMWREGETEAGLKWPGRGCQWERKEERTKERLKTRTSLSGVISN